MSPVIYCLELLGVAVFAISGALAAGRKGLDWVGAVFLAVVTALGGGTLRDILLDRDTVFWVADTTYLWVIFVTILFIIPCKRFFTPSRNMLLLADALGLAAFTIIGARVAEAEGASALIIVIMAVLTGVAGGITRDILTHEIPSIFRPSEPLYSVAATGGAILYVLFKKYGLSTPVSACTGVAFIATARCAAILLKIHMPAFSVPENR